MHNNLTQNPIMIPLFNPQRELLKQKLITLAILWGNDHQMEYDGIDEDGLLTWNGLDGRYYRMSAETLIYDEQATATADPL